MDRKVVFSRSSFRRGLMEVMDDFIDDDPCTVNEVVNTITIAVCKSAPSHHYGLKFPGYGSPLHITSS